MSKVIIDHLTKYYGDRKIFEDISAVIGEGKKVGLVGKNGQGKTTLMRILAGEEKGDEGTCQIYGEIGYLPQQMKNQEGSLRSCLAQEGAWDYQIKKAMDRVQLSEELLNSSLGILSGGERTRASMAKVLLREPEILMLDEPTNHLDISAVNWLENFVASFQGTVILVSHDRRFLDNTVDTIYELEDGTLQEYPGNYSQYAKLKQEEIQRQQDEYEHYVDEKRRLEEAVRKKMERSQRAARKKRPRDSFEARERKDFFEGKAKKMAQNAKALEGRLEKLERKEKPREYKGIHMILDTQEGLISRVLIKGEGLKKGFGDRILFSEASFEIERGKRIALLGDNGAGKSTLIHIIRGALSPDRGSVHRAPKVRIGYLDQELNQMNESHSILQEVWGDGRRKQEELRTLLGCLLFRGEDVYKPIQVLSMGEKVRVTLAKLILSDCNLLILDEPTNHLDLPSREAVEAALIDYQGTLLFVSHDRYFLEKMADQIWEIREKRLQCNDLSYGEYIKKMSLVESRINQQDLLLLETRLSQLSALLNGCADETEKRELDQEFFRVARRIQELKAARS